MQKKYFIYMLFSMVTALGLTSCDDYLDLAPDNRAELDTKEKISHWLVSAYSRASFLMAAEMASDNTDHRVVPSNVTFAYKNQEDCFWWDKNVDDTGNDSPVRAWTSYYNSIEVANRAIEAIEKLGNTADLQPQRGEALMLRAYYHFLLVNMFSLHYSEATAQTDMGIPYRGHSESVLNPSADRGTVAEVYAKIAEDIEAGVPLIDDNAYGGALKYHFNRKAACAFASRFYLFYGKYDKVIEYSNRALGTDLDKTLRKMSKYTTLSTDVQIRCQEWINPSNDCNFMITSLNSALGSMFSAYTTGKLYQHTLAVQLNETFRAPAPWRNAYAAADWYLPANYYTSSGYTIYYRTPNAFEYTDPIAKTGYSHTIYTAFTAEEALLNRAEAYIVREEYDKALSDLDNWMKVYIKPNSGQLALTRDRINALYGSMAYYTPTEPTPKKAIHPLNFTVKSEEQENFLHCLLFFRRIETAFLGLRWFDVKRFGIEIYRRDVSYLNGTNDQVAAVPDSLKLNDPRRAMQIPAVAIEGGVQPNPRNN